MLTTGGGAIAMIVRLLLVSDREGGGDFMPLWRSGDLGGGLTLSSDLTTPNLHDNLYLSQSTFQDHGGNRVVHPLDTVKHN